MLQLVLGTNEVIISPGDTALLMLTIVKLLLVGAVGLYLVFSFVVIRQIQIMRNTVVTPAAGLIQVLGLAHLVLAVVVFMFFILLL